MDKVFIQNLELFSLIGVYDFERHEKQRVVVDLVIETDLAKPCVSDNVEHTIDYGKVAERLEDIALASEYKLLEALAHEMINCILSEFGASGVTLKMHKPDILDNASSVGIEMTRRNTEQCDAI